MKTKITILSLLLSVAMLSGCLQTSETKSPGDGVSKSASAKFEIRDLPDPNRMSQEEVSRYFTGHKQYKGTYSYKHSVSSRLGAICGPVIPSMIGGSERAKIAYYQKMRAPAETEKRAKCWADRAPGVIERRAAELVYLNGILDANMRFWRGDAEKTRLLTFNQKAHFNDKTLESDIDFLAYEMRNFASVGLALLKKISSARGFQNDRRQSNQRAWGHALNEFSKDNPFNRPGPGQNPNANITRTSTMIPGASPALQLALDQMDRTMFGEQAFYKALARDISISSATRSDGAKSLITLESNCPYGRKTDNSCISRAQVDAANQAAADQRERDYLAESARRIGAQTEAARVAVGQTNDAFARSCGYSSYSELLARENGPATQCGRN